MQRLSSATVRLAKYLLQSIRWPSVRSMVSLVKVHSLSTRGPQSSSRNCLRILCAFLGAWTWPAAFKLSASATVNGIAMAVLHDPRDAARGGGGEETSSARRMCGTHTKLLLNSSKESHQPSATTKLLTGVLFAEPAMTLALAMAMALAMTMHYDTMAMA